GKRLKWAQRPGLPEPHAAAYVNVQTHDRATLGLALVLDIDAAGHQIRNARAVVGSVSAIPSRSDKTDAALVGPRSQVERQLNDTAAALADTADPVDDLQGSADYKRHLIGVFLKRAFIRALAET